MTSALYFWKNCQRWLTWLWSDSFQYRWHLSQQVARSAPWFIGFIRRVNVYILSQLHAPSTYYELILLNDHATSLTRFGEISLLRQNLKWLWQILIGSISIWQNLEHTWANCLCYWANFQCYKWPNIEKVIQPSGSMTRFGKNFLLRQNFTSIWQFLTVYFLFGKMLNQLWQIY